MPPPTVKPVLIDDAEPAKQAVLVVQLNENPPSVPRKRHTGDSIAGISAAIRDSSVGEAAARKQQQIVGRQEAETAADGAIPIDVLLFRYGLREQDWRRCRTDVLLPVPLRLDPLKSVSMPTSQARSTCQLYPASKPPVTPLTVREPVIVLDKGLRVIAASRSFYSAFEVSPEAFPIAYKLLRALF
jgi:hypothetical protein